MGAPEAEHGERERGNREHGDRERGDRERGDCWHGKRERGDRWKSLPGNSGVTKGGPFARSRPFFRKAWNQDTEDWFRRVP